MIEDVNARVAAYRGNPEALQQKYAMGQDLLDLLALQKIKSEKEAAARQMQLMMGQQQAASGQAPATVAEQREKEVLALTKNELAQQQGALLQEKQKDQQEALQKLAQGIASTPGANTVAQPQAMAAGGIVGYAGPQGSQVQDREVERILRKPPHERTQEDNATLERAGYKLQRAQIPKGSAVDRANTALTDAGANARSALSGGTNRMSDEELARQPAAGGALNERILRTLGMEQSKPAAAPTAPTAPAASAGPNLAALRGQINAAERRASPETYETPARRPAPAPAAPAAPAAAPVQQAGLPTLTAPTMMPEAVSAIKQDVARDPFAHQLGEEKRIETKMAPSKEYLELLRQNQAKRQGMYDETYDPERQRREGLIRFLTGAGGRAYGELGAGAQAGMAYDEAQRQNRLKDFESIAGQSERPFTLQRDATKAGIEGGLKGLEAASKQRTAGLGAAGEKFRGEASVYSTDVQAREGGLNRQVEMARIAAQNARNAIDKGALDLSRLSAAQSGLIGRLDAVKKAAQDEFMGSVGMLVAQRSNGAKLKPEQEAAIKQAELARDIRIAEVEREVRPTLELIQSKMGASMGDGFGTVKKVSPTK